jgi:hypothetical protein
MRVLICLCSGKVIDLEKISVGTQKDEDSIDLYLFCNYMFIYKNFSILLDKFLSKGLFNICIKFTGFRREIYFGQRQCDEMMKSGGEMEWRTR